MSEEPIEFKLFCPESRKRFPAELIPFQLSRDSMFMQWYCICGKVHRGRTSKEGRPQLMELNRQIMWRHVALLAEDESLTQIESWLTKWKVRPSWHESV